MWLSAARKLSLGVVVAVIVSTLNACDSSVSNANNASKKNETPIWNAQERQLLLSLSISQLPPVAEDLSNRYQNNPDAVIFGSKLFFDPRLSESGTISCSACHQPSRDFSDGLRVATGTGKGKRNTPSLLGVSHQKWFFWDGRKDSVWAQALEPFEDKAEHNLSRTKLIKIVLGDPYYRTLYQRLFGDVPETVNLELLPDNASPKRDLENLKAWKRLSVKSRAGINLVFSNLGKALAAYQATLSHKISRFDRYLTDLKENKLSGNLKKTEELGLKLFIGKAKCTACHFSPLLSNQHFQNIGTGILGGDMGRSRIAESQAWDEFNCLGEYSDAPKSYCKNLHFMSKDRHALSGSFKVPSLRNISKTAPYLHDGRFTKLEQVIDFYVNSSNKNRSDNHLPVITLSDEEKHQLAAFLNTL